jgi:hypothetical protein
VAPFSNEGIAVLSRGRDVLYCFDGERRLRDLPYLDLLETMRQEIGLTAHKVRHGYLLDEPDALPSLRRLLAGIEDAGETFRRAFEALESRKSETWPESKAGGDTDGRETRRHVL